MSSLLWVVLLLVPSVLSQNVDLTRMPGASGSEVVQAVVDLIRESCIFPNDKLFLRRLAYVKSVDGTDPKTHIPNSGGIWQVNTTQFAQIQNSLVANNLFSTINIHFGINWQSVQLAELTKPLYSGIGAALLITAVGKVVPRKIEVQSAYYANNFDSDANAANHFYNTISSLPKACKMNNLDLVFVVDTSASLAFTDFQKAKQFASQMIDSFTIGLNGVQVSFVTFSSGFKVHFKLNDHLTRDSIKNAISLVTYTPGATATGAALSYVTNNVLTSAGGARLDASKVVLLITDGNSTDHSKAVQAADDARKRGILIFAIGVGNKTYTDELNLMATKPSCTHVIKLQGYSDLDALINEIQQASCKAPLIVTSGQHTFKCQQSQLFRIPTSGPTTITIVPTNGHINIYGSFFTPTPSKTFSDFETAASLQTGAVVFVTHDNRPLYLNVTADIYGGCVGQFSIDVEGLKVVIPNSVVTCIDHSIVQTCSVVDVLNTLYSVLQPPPGFPNPCTAGHAVYLPHPYSYAQFLYCAPNGTLYIVQCPAHTIYDRNNITCIHGEPPSTIPTTTAATTITTPTTTNQAVVTSMGNMVVGYPCTKENIAQQRFYHPYPQDPTKYIDCTNWPSYGIVKQCDPHKKWDQRDLTCTYIDTVISPANGTYSNLANICKNPMGAQDLFFYAHPTDPHKYIHCDQYGDAFLKTCPDNKFWVQDLFTCIPHGLVGKR